MALFGIGKKKEAKKEVAKESPKAVKASSKTSSKTPVVVGLKDVILRPRVTEKAANLTSMNVYTFDVRQSATKHDIVRAVKKLYKVTPMKIRVVNTKGKRVAMRRRRGFGMTAASRKAYVYLKKGDQIQLA